MHIKMIISDYIFKVPYVLYIKINMIKIKYM